jgi:hypothetical protein
MRKAGEVSYADVRRDRDGEGSVIVMSMKRSFYTAPLTIPIHLFVTVLSNSLRMIACKMPLENLMVLTSRVRV